MRVILASTSPRRHDLLALLHIPFEIAAPTYVEQLNPDFSPVDQVRLFAKGKARSCQDAFPNSIIIGCDTLIAIDANVLGKPADGAEAARMLKRLSGRRHVIHTSVAVLSTSTGHLETAEETVQVWFKLLTPSDIEAYVATGDSLGKAGAYGIQGRGAELIGRIDGDYTAAVGLPLKALAQILSGYGVTIPIDLTRLYQQKPYPNWERFPSSTRV
jgi:septum formation protein